jgi:hypothetical protein
MALITLAFLSTVGGGVAAYTSSNLRHSYTDQSSATAYHLAEAGLAEAISKIQGAADPTVSSILSTPLTVTAPAMGANATYTYSGTNSTDTDHLKLTWLITSTGSVGNPVRTRTLTQTVLVRATIPGGDLNSWSRFYSDDPNRCLTIDTVNMPAPIATQSDLCLVNGASITGAGNTVIAGGNVYISGPVVDSGPRTSTGTATGWTNPNNGRTNDGTYATNAIAANATGATETLTGFGFAIPAAAQIKGITVTVERNASATSSIRDNSVLLQKSSTVAAPTNKAVTSTSWSTSDTGKTYGSTTDLWGATWTPAEINASTFGLRFQAKNVNTTSSRTASLDYVEITVSYITDTNGIGTAATPVASVQVGGASGCKYNLNSAHNPCTATDHVNATAVDMTHNTDLQMPDLELQTWFDAARPGPKHPCTNVGNNFAPLAFDNDGSADSNDSMQFDNSGTYDMAPTNRDYDCQVIENGILVGRLAWNHTTHVLTVGGTIFFDGDVRFDNDGQLVHYQGRALIYAAGNVEFDALVCADGDTHPGTSYSCASPSTNMSNWNPQKNFLTLFAAGDSEYDQGGSSCSGMAAGTVCGGIHPQSGFQGLVAAKGTCLIHERFFLSGPVVCGYIDMPYETDGWPTYFPFPAFTNIGSDGQQYGSLDGADQWVVTPGPVAG